MPPATDYDASSHYCADDGEAEQGVGPPQSLSCPYIIPAEEEAEARGRDASISGNLLVVSDFKMARMGNRFVALSRSLSLGFCCKSKLVSTTVLWP